MNQPKVLVHLTQPEDPSLRGSFNWTFEYDADLAVPQSDFPRNRSWGKAEWWRDSKTGIGHVRLFSQTSSMYPWTCTYFSADVNGVKANQLYDGRGIMTEAPHPPDFIVRYFLDVRGFFWGHISPLLRLCGRLRHRCAGGGCVHLESPLRPVLI